jgi:CBS domain containing-hemolysin-like protein
MPDLLIVLLVVLVLVVLNGLFVAAEFAIIGTPRAAIAAQAESGSRRARQIRTILDDPTRLDRYVATAQLGITFASLGLGMYGEHSLAIFFEHWLTAVGFTGLGAQITAHGLAVVLAIVAITYLHIVFGEMIPKALALTHAVRVALWVTPIMLMIGLVLYPLVRALNLTGNNLLRLVGVVRSRSAEHYLETEELESLARESQQSGLLSEESERIFREIADFSEITAAEAMIPRVHTYGIPVGATVAELREILPVHRHTRYPVYDGNLDHIVGTVHIKDLLNLLHERSGLVPAVVRKAAYLPETATLDDVLKAMERTRNQMVIVMDEHGGTAGILTIEDICAEAIGDIEEGADDVPDVLPVGLGRFQVQGSARLGMIGALVGRELDHPAVDSVSGLILSELGRPPRLGDQVRWNGLNFEVFSLHGRGVRQAIVSLIDDGSQLNSESEPG